MSILLSGYVMYSLTSILIFVALATILHLQFGVTGIVNFGFVGFWGVGMYGLGVFLLKFHIPYILSLVLATGLSGILAIALGSIILDLESQAVLVATLAFATIIKDLVTTEKWLTKGVIGIGTVPFPIDLGEYSAFGFFVLILICTLALFYYARKIESSPYGRLLLGIQDNETLAKSLGKSTSRQKLIFFGVTCALIGFFGALNASINHFLVPRMLDPGMTFTVWIALIIGGRKRILGGLVGTIVTLGIFDFVIETFVPLPREYSQLVPVIKLMLYGLTLMLVLMFRPMGILGTKKKQANLFPVKTKKESEG